MSFRWKGNRRTVLSRVAVALACLSILSLWNSVVMEGRLAFAAERSGDAPLSDGPQIPGALPRVDTQVAKRLQPIIDQACPGDVLRLEEGVYQGPVRIDKPLHLIGNGHVVIDGGGVGPVIRVDADWVKLEGLVIRNSGHRSREDKAGVLLNGSYCQVVKNRFEKCVMGIILTENQGNRITGNQFDGFRDKAVHLRGNAIDLDRTHNNRIENNRIDGFQDGVYVERSTKNLLVGNRVTRSRYGFHFMIQADRNQVRQNEVGQSRIGVLVMESDQIVITGNRLHGNRSFQGYGVVLYGTEGTVVKNNVIADNAIGLMLEKATNNRVVENTVIGNQLGLEATAEAMDNQIVRNNFIANQWQVRQAGDWTNMLGDGIKGNFWDDYLGLDRDGDGVGDAPHEVQRWFSVLTARFPVLELYSHSPAVAALMSIPVGGEGEPVDRYPLVKPMQWEEPDERPMQWQNVTLFGAVFFLGVMGLIMGINEERVN